MFNQIKNLKEVERSASGKDLARIGLVFGLALVIVIINFFFLPTSVSVLNLIFLFVAAVLMIMGYARLARSFSDNKIKNLELESVIENIPDGVVVYDTNFLILSVNGAAEKIFGLSSAEILGKYVTPDSIKNPRLRVLTQVIFPSLAPAMTVISDSGWPQIIDLSLEDPKIELRTVLNRVIDDKNRVVGFLKLVTDLTREKNIIDSKAEFISVAAHQLRTPLTAINWSFESLNKVLAENNPSVKEATDLAKEGSQLAERSLKIVNDLLNAARIEGGRFGFNLEETDLTEFILALLDQARLAAKEYGIKMNFVPGNAKFRVKIDKELLGMAIANILDNGIKYNSKNGEVTVTLGPDATANFARIEISDTGVGISGEDLAKIFQKFHRGSNVTRIEPNGSGLGLYISKNVVERLGGKLSVDSQIGRGTTFTIFLPLNFDLIPAQS